MQSFEKQCNLEWLDLRTNFLSSELTGRILRVFTETDILNNIKCLLFGNVNFEQDEVC